jgi:acetyl esterase/lipase
MKRKIILLGLLIPILLACNFPISSLPFFPQTATPIFTPSPTATSTPTATPTATPTPISYPPILNVPVTPGLVVHNIVYCTNDIPIKMDVYFPQTMAGPAPALLYIHGGGWIGGDKDKSVGLEDIPALTAAGYLVANVDYRRAPKYPFPAMIVDVKCAVRFLRARAAEFNIRPDRIGAWGSSAGGQIVSLLGLADASAGWDVGEYSEQSSRIQAVVDMFGPTDLTDPVYQKRFEKKGYLLFDVMDPSLFLLASASPVTYVSTNDPPFLIIHGDQDTVVAFNQSELLYQRLTLFGVPAELFIVRQSNHNFVPMGDAIIPSRAEITQRLVEFFDKFLKTLP